MKDKESLVKIIEALCCSDNVYDPVSTFLDFLFLFTFGAAVTSGSRSVSFQSVSNIFWCTDCSWNRALCGLRVGLVWHHVCIHLSCTDIVSFFINGL